MRSILSSCAALLASAFTATRNYFPLLTSNEDLSSTPFGSDPNFRNHEFVIGDVDPTTRTIATTTLTSSLPVPMPSHRVVQWIVNNTMLAPDGYNRSTVVVNGQYPGPLLHANKGDIMHVNVTNILTDTSMSTGTTIHWHGLFEGRDAEYDGVAFVTQCPIPQNKSFQYILPTANQVGTFWYHSHLDTQYVDGLRGPLVIYDPNDPRKSMYDYDNETTIIQIGDWYHNSSIWVWDNTQPLDVSSTTINGKGRYQGGPPQPRFVLDVAKGSRYRLRIINNSALLSYNFSIPGHPLTVIAADAVDHVPLTVDYFTIAPAQRYDAILDANQPVDNYWINIGETNPTSGILRYQGAPQQDPTTPLEPPSGTPLLEYNLHPVNTSGCSDTADVIFNLNVTFIDGKPEGKFFFSNISYTPPELPTLLKILSHNLSFTTTENTVFLPPNKVIELQLTSGPTQGSHPFHLHGHTFNVHQSGIANAPFKKCSDFPPRRDVVEVDAGYTAIIRFNTDNPGPWFFHCHKDWHLKMGLAMVFAEDIQSQQQSLKPPRSWYNLCGPGF